jgi:molecular chaperone HtpG
LDIGKRTERGTTITLHVDKENDDFLDPTHVASLLEHYCAFLPYPIYLGERLINTHFPLWIKAPNECSDQEYRDFYHYLYPTEEEPLFWLHLNVDYPFHLKGILYFPKLHKDFDFKRSTVKLYCNRVFVADNCKDVLPEYLMALRGVIDSPDIPLNVSRSYLQLDRTVRRLSGHIAKKVADSLLALWRTDHEKFLASWDDLSTVIKLGAVEDEKFYERIKELLLWKTVEGTWTTAEEYLERNKDKVENKIYYTRDELHATHLLELYKQKGIEVICAPHALDAYLIQFLERKLPATKFIRYDSAIHDTLLDTSREKSLLDASGKTEATQLADLIRSKLPKDGIEVEAKSLASDALPALVVFGEDERRMRDYMRMMSRGKEDLPHFGKTTFVVNTNNPLINALPKLEKLNPELAQEVVQQTYELALLSQREIDVKSLNAFIARTSHVLEKLALQATE